MEHSEAWFLSKIVGSMVVALGFVIFFNLTKPIDGDADTRSDRAPSSLIKISEIEKTEIISKSIVSTLDLNCIDKPKVVDLKSQSKQLRIIGKWCEDNENQEELFFSNVTNGFDATVFNTAKNSFTTDYVYLNDGENLIVISKLDVETGLAEQIFEMKIERQDKFVLDGTQDFQNEY